MPENRMKRYFENTTGGLTESDVRETLGQQLEHRPNNSAACAIAYDKGYDAGKDEGREEMRIILNKHHRAAIAIAEHEGYTQGAWDVAVYCSVVAGALVLVWWRLL